MKDDLNKKLSAHQSAVDPAEIWAAIEPKVDALYEKKKRKRRFILLFFFGLGVCGLTSLWFYNNNRIPQQHLSDSLLVHTATEKSDKKSKDGNTTVSIQDELQKKMPQTQGTQNNKELVQTNRSIESTTNSNIGANQTTATKDIKQNNNEKTSIDNKVARTKTAINEAKHNNNNNNNRNSNSISIDKSNSSSSEKVSNINKQTAKNQTRSSSESYTPSTPTNSATPQSKNTSAPEDIHMTSSSDVKKNNIVDDSRSKASILNKIALIKAELLHRSDDARSLTPLAAMTPPKRKNKRKSNDYFDMRIGIHGGLAAISRNLEATDASLESYRQLRDNTESMLEAVSYGLDLQVAHASGFSIQLGFNNVQINERFDSEHMTIDTTVLNDVIYRVVNLMSDTVDIYGDVSVYDFTKTTYEIYNQHELIELPILLGYAHSFSKWRLGVQAGVLANIKVKSTGRIFNEMGQVVQLTNENPYTTKLDFGFQYGLSIERELSEHISIRLTPVMKIYPDIMKSGSNLSNKYTLFGAQMGAVYSF